MASLKNERALGSSLDDQRELIAVATTPSILSVKVPR